MEEKVYLLGGSFLKSQPQTKEWEISMVIDLYRGLMPMDLMVYKIIKVIS
jgi:hypothetical protein